MLAKKITSLQHPIVKHFVKLRENKKFRYENEQIVLAGKKLIREANELEILLCEENSDCNKKAKEKYFVTPQILKKVTGLESPEEVAATIQMPKWQNLKKKNWILAFDGVNDPGNLGTLIRTACALGWEGAFLTDDCVDPFNEKALRAAKGASLHLPLQKGTKEELFELAKNFTTYVADLTGTPLSQIKSKNKTLLILGNEAHGPSGQIKKEFSSITVPISAVDSLNVATAGAILMYGLKHDR